MRTLKQVFRNGVTVNTYADVVIWTEHGKLNMPRKDAKAFIRVLINEGVPVRAYWKDCTKRERLLDARISEGYVA